jgi:hypothetical protein
MNVIIFRVIVWFVFLSFGAIKAPLSGMDDRQTRGAVTNFWREISGLGKDEDYLVTIVRSRLSSFLVWTAFALHG